MREIEVTWRRAFLVWFHILWRVLLYATLAGFVVSLVTTIIFNILGMDQQTIKTLNLYIGGVIGLGVNIWVVKTVLNLRVRNFRVALLEN